MGATIQKNDNKNTKKRVLDIGLAIVLAVGAILAVRAILGDFNKISRDKESGDISVSSGEPQLDGEFIYVSDSADNDSVYSGPLILVNSQKKYQGNSDDLVSMYDVMDKADSKDFYSVFDQDVLLREEAAKNLDKMLTAFYTETGIDDIQVTGGYRSIDKQQEYYDDADDKTGVSEPGYSDYHTGYSADIDAVDEDGESIGFDGTGDYEWFMENCYKFGFVVRAPEGKTEQTGLDYRPWHFRYVGIPHSYYMHEKNLCLEEYIEMLKSYSYIEDHLEVTAEGKKYEIYYIIMDNEASTTLISVPSDKSYTVSGNNTDGFIITVDLDSDTSVEQETAPPESTDNSNDDSDKSKDEAEAHEESDSDDDGEE